MSSMQKQEIELTLTPFIESLTNKNVDFGLNYNDNVKKGMTNLDKKTKKIISDIMTKCS